MRQDVPLDQIPHPSQESRDPFPTDSLLRRRGFSIHSRPDLGEPLWEKGGKVYTQAEALLVPVVKLKK